MSGHSPLLQIAITCAAIVIGSAIVGSQLSTSGNLSRVASGVADEEDAGVIEDADHEESYEETVDEDSEDADDYADSGDQSHDNGEDHHLAELTDEEPDAETFGSDGEVMPEGEAKRESGDQAEKDADEEGGLAVIRRNP